MKPRTFEIKVDSFRKIPNPYKEGASSVSQMYTAICDVKDLPEDLVDWMETNPRKQNTNSGVAKKIKASLTESKDFHLLNRGILLSAQDVTYNNYDNTMRLVFTDSEVHGNVDGGHTLMVILENRDELERGTQYVKLEILTGVEAIFEDLAAARNTSTQVQDKSIANLRDYFDLIKEVIATESFRDQVYFMENDNGTIDVGEVLAILNLFNIDAYKGMDSFPVVSFSSKKRCIDGYITLYEKYMDDPANPYVKMKPVMVDIFRLYDYLETKMQDYYRAKNPAGKYGSISGVITPKADAKKQPETKFYRTPMSHTSPNGFIYPVLGALRALLVEENGAYKWTQNPFKILDEVGPDLVCTTIERSRTLGNDPVKVGKDTGNWQTLYMRVAFAAMTSK